MSSGNTTANYASSAAKISKGVLANRWNLTAQLEGKLSKGLYSAKRDICKPSEK